MSIVTDFLALLQRRLTLIVATIVVGALVVLLLLLKMHPTYQASAQVMSVGDRSGSEPAISFNDLPSVATSTAVLGRVADKLALSVPLTSLQGAVKVRASSGSNIISISYQNAVPAVAVAVPNVVAEELANYAEEMSTRQSNADIRKLTVAVDEQKQKLESINRRLASTQVDGLALGDDKAVEAVAARLDDLQTQRSFAQATLQGDIALADAATSSQAVLDRMGNHEILQSDPVYRDLSESGAKDQTELAIDRGLFKSDYPGFPGLEAKVRAGAAALKRQRESALHSSDAFSPGRDVSEAQARKAQATVVADRARVASLDSLISTTHQRMQAAPRATLASSYLELQRDAARAEYLALSARLSTAVANRTLALGSIIVLDRAVNSDAIVVGLTRSKLVLMLAALVLVVAIGLAILAETLDPRLLGPKSIENVYGLPLVTTLKSD